MRETRQQEAVQAYFDSVDGRTIINACPRFGKIKVAIDIMKRMRMEYPAIIAPRVDIEAGWKKDFEKFGYKGHYAFYTTRSVHKIPDRTHDLYILDELHEFSLPQQEKLSKKIPESMGILGLTGTITQKTRQKLYDNLGLDVCYKYSIDQGVEEGILADYQIFVHQVDLQGSEKRRFSSLDYVYEESKHTNFFVMLKMINLIQNSVSKRAKTQQLIEQAGNERVLVFCGTTEIADNFGIPVYHSKAKEKDIFNAFCTGEGDKLATIKMMQAGITITPIRKGIINYMSGNPEDCAQKICRFLGFEYDSPDKKAEIHIVSSTEPFELTRLKTGLSFFNKSKIEYLCA